MCLSKTVQNFYNLLVIVQIGELKPSFKIGQSVLCICRSRRLAEQILVLHIQNTMCQVFVACDKNCQKYSLEMKVPKATSSGMKRRRHLNFHL